MFFLHDLEEFPRTCPNSLKRYVLTKFSRRIKDDHSVKALNPLFKEKCLSPCHGSEYSNKPGNVSILVGVNLQGGKGSEIPLTTSKSKDRPVDGSDLWGGELSPKRSKPIPLVEVVRGVGISFDGLGVWRSLPTSTGIGAAARGHLSHNPNSSSPSCIYSSCIRRCVSTHWFCPP